MYFRDNVQDLCDVLGIANPIEEFQLEVSALSFMINGEWQHISGTKLNRAGRLFFQNQFPGTQHLGAFCLYDTNRRRGQDFFAENWLDAEEKGRIMLISFKTASKVLIHWK